jgi:DNA recombination-dependent growth factor C
MEQIVDGDGMDFIATDCAVLKGNNKKTIRIKDRDIESSEVQGLIGFDDNDYQVHELGISAADSDDNYESLKFVVNEHLVFKRCTLPDVKATLFKEDAHGFALLCAQTYKLVLLDLVQAMGGMKPRPDSEKTASNDEDEL